MYGLSYFRYNILIIHTFVSHLAEGVKTTSYEKIE